MATASAERSRFRHGVEGGVGNAPARFPVASFSAAAAVPRRMGEPNPPPPSPPSPPNPPNPSEAFAPSDAWLPPRLDARPPNEKLAALSPAPRPAPRELPPTGLNGDGGARESESEPVSEKAGPFANPSAQPILGGGPAGAAASSPGDSESGCGSD